ISNTVRNNRRLLQTASNEQVSSAAPRDAFICTFHYYLGSLEPGTNIL
ncbi:21735_t:CDS:1, partial [Dentiscutata erythropus]